jgi:hypothetical protein
MATDACRRARGFVLVEALATALIVLVVACVLAVLTQQNRRHARLGRCLANLRWFGEAGAAYASDSADRVWTFSWKRTDASYPANPTTYADHRTASTDLEAAEHQAVVILRERAGREDISFISNWLPHMFYSHLVLADYAAARQPLAPAVCPEDAGRVAWSADPQGYDACLYRPNPECSGNSARRWPYSSSYEMQLSFCSPDAASGTTTTISQAIGGGHQGLSVPPATRLGRRWMTEVAFPSQKLLLYETVARHHGPRSTFFAYEESRTPSLAADGAAHVLLTSATNQGWNPTQPDDTYPGMVQYVPAPAPNDWEPRPLNGLNSEWLNSHFRWTRRGLAGRDFGAPAVP